MAENPDKRRHKKMSGKLFTVVLLVALSLLAIGWFFDSVTTQRIWLPVACAWLIGLLAGSALEEELMAIRVRKGENSCRLTSPEGRIIWFFRLFTIFLTGMLLGCWTT
jgi:hypothetical protein